MKRAGRKRYVVTVRMTREEREQWRALARQRQVSLSDMVRAAVLKSQS